MNFLLQFHRMPGNKFPKDKEKDATEWLRSREISERRKCSKCSRWLALSQFNGRIVRTMEWLHVSFSTSCKACFRKKNVEHVNKIRRGKEYKEIIKFTRSRLGSKNDLKAKDIRMMLTCPCYFCGSGKVTIGKRDESKSHSRKNSVPCCIECLDLKSKTPPEKWKEEIKSRWVTRMSNKS